MEQESLRLKEDAEKQAKEAKYMDNNFWKLSSDAEKDIDIDEMMKEMD